ncbi:hypothetical protein ACLK1S_16695 [Escherichia coli]
MVITIIPEWNFNVVKTGDTLDIGNGKQLIFVENTNAALAGQRDDLPDRRRGVSVTMLSVSTTATSICSTMKSNRRSFSSSASVTTPIS